jgi:hypothetical protein
MSGASRFLQSHFVELDKVATLEVLSAGFIGVNSVRSNALAPNELKVTSESMTPDLND